MPARAGHPRRTARNGVLTLTTDIGWAYAAQVKGALYHASGRLRVVDLAHELPAHQIAEAAFVLRAMAGAFPPGTVHVAVIDPGVGGPRDPLVIETGEGSALVGPDNGVLAPLAGLLGGAKAYRIDPGRIATRPRVGTTFDGRDVFAPAAARLALGARGAELGRPTRYRKLRLPRPVRSPGWLRGQVLHVDRFGNLITNIPTHWISPGGSELVVAVGQQRARSVPWTTSYLRIGRGRLGALGSSFGSVEIAVGEGRADRRLRARVGNAVRIGRTRRRGVRVRETLKGRARLRA